MNSQLQAANVLAGESSHWMFQVAWQSALVGVIVVAVCRMFPRMPAQFKYALLLVALIKFACPPFFAMPTGLFSQIYVDKSLSSVETDRSSDFLQHPAGSIRQRPLDDAQVNDATLQIAPPNDLRTSTRDSIQWSREDSRKAPWLDAKSEAAAYSLTFAMDDTKRSSLMQWFSWRLVAMVIYGCGVCLLASSIVYQWLKLFFIVRTSNPLPEHVMQRYAIPKLLGLEQSRNRCFAKIVPRIIVSDCVTAPVSAGLLRPVILLPQDLHQRISPTEFKAVLLHEWAHHRRGDLWLNLIQLLLCSAWWFHPVIWMVSRSLRRVREDCCDDFVLQRQLVGDQEYCDTLLQVAGMACRSSPALVLSMTTGGHSLKRRISRIMDETICRKSMSWKLWICWLLFAAVSLPGLSLRAEEQPRTDVDAKEDNRSVKSAELQTLRGKVEDQDGNPISAAKVWATVRFTWRELFIVSNWQVAIDETPSWTGIARIGLNNDGTFSIPAIREGNIKILARKNNDSDWLANPPLDVNVSAGETTVLEIPLVRAVTVTGQTVERESQKPLANVRAFIYGGDHQQLAISDAAGILTAKVRPGFNGSIRFHPPSPFFVPQGVNPEGQTLLVPMKQSKIRFATAEFVRRDEINRVAIEQNRAADFKVNVKEKAAQEEPREDPVRPKIQTADLTGTVTDELGRPIAGARVVIWSLAKRSQKQTDGEGNFKFSDVSARGVWVFANAAGYRYFGSFHEPTKPRNITLISSAKPAKPTIQPHVHSRLDNKTRKILKQRLRKFGEVVMAADDANLKMDLQRMLPQIDPDFALTLLGDSRFNANDINWGGKPMDHNQWHKNCVRLFSMRYWLKRDIAKAQQVATTVSDTGFGVLTEVIDHLPAGSAAEKSKLFEAAEQRARQVASPADRAMDLANVAARYFDDGNKVDALRVFDEARQHIKDAPQEEHTEYATAMLAWMMAPADTESAIRIVTGIRPKKQSSMGRYFGNVAHRLAKINPDVAEQMLERIPENERDSWAIRVCCDMSDVDHLRAVMIADRINEPPLQAYALGLIARNIAAKNPKAAKKRMQFAFQRMEKLIESGYSSGRSVYAAFPVALAMLQDAEVADPKNLDNYFWKVLSWRRNISYGHTTRLLGRYGTKDTLRLSDPVLAAFVARYDLDAAKHILMPKDDEELDLGIAHAPHFFFGGLAAIDPRAAIESVSKLPATTSDERKKKCKAWRYLISVAGREGEDRANWLRGDLFNLWVPGNFDI